MAKEGGQERESASAQTIMRGGRGRLFRCMRTDGDELRTSRLFVAVDILMVTTAGENMVRPGYTMSYLEEEEEAVNLVNIDGTWWMCSSRGDWRECDDVAGVVALTQGELNALRKMRGRWEPDLHEPVIGSCARRGDLGGVKDLVDNVRRDEKRGVVNAAGHLGGLHYDTALHAAAKAGRAGVVRYLLSDCLADPTLEMVGAAAAAGGATPLDVACTELGAAGVFPADPSQLALFARVGDRAPIGSGLQTDYGGMAPRECARSVLTRAAEAAATVALLTAAAPFWSRTAASAHDAGSRDYGAPPEFRALRCALGAVRVASPDAAAIEALTSTIARLRETNAVAPRDPAALDHDGFLATFRIGDPVQVLGLTSASGSRWNGSVGRVVKLATTEAGGGYELDMLSMGRGHSSVGSEIFDSSCLRQLGLVDHHSFARPRSPRCQIQIRKGAEAAALARQSKLLDEGDVNRVCAGGCGRLATRLAKPPGSTLRSQWLPIGTGCLAPCESGDGFRCTERRTTFDFSITGAREEFFITILRFVVHRNFNGEDYSKEEVVEFLTSLTVRPNTMSHVTILLNEMASVLFAPTNAFQETTTRKVLRLTIASMLRHWVDDDAGTRISTFLGRAVVEVADDGGLRTVGEGRTFSTNIRSVRANTIALPTSSAADEGAASSDS